MSENEEQNTALEIEIYLKSGAVVRAQVVRWTLKYNGLGHLTGAEWETPNFDRARKLSYIDIADISAVVAVR